MFVFIWFDMSHHLRFIFAFHAQLCFAFASHFCSASFTSIWFCRKYAPFSSRIIRGCMSSLIFDFSSFDLMVSIIFWDFIVCLNCHQLGFIFDSFPHHMIDFYTSFIACSLAFTRFSDVSIYPLSVLICFHFHKVFGGVFKSARIFQQGFDWSVSITLY